MSPRTLEYWSALAERSHLMDYYYYDRGRPVCQAVMIRDREPTTITEGERTYQIEHHTERAALLTLADIIFGGYK